MRSLPAIVVFAAAGAGYVYTHPEVANGLTLKNWISEVESEFDLTGPSSGTTEKSAPAPEVVARLASARHEDLIAVPGPQVSDFGDIFRFDLTPQTVAERWSRVSTSLSDPQFQGYRVPLVTGQNDTDLAGSLTYYYDGRPQMRRITFLGTTGNPNRLVGYMAKYYGFRQAKSDSPRSMIYRTQSRVRGELTVTPAEVLDHSLASTNYRVVLWLQR